MATTLFSASVADKVGEEVKGRRQGWATVGQHLALKDAVDRQLR